MYLVVPFSTPARPLYSQEKDILCLWDILFAVCGDRDVLWAVVYRVVLELMRLSEDSILELSTLPSIVGGMSKVCVCVCLKNHFIIHTLLSSD